MMEIRGKKFGVVDNEDFGFPGPNVQYRSRTLKGWKDKKRSDWLYYCQHLRLSLPSHIL